AFERAAELDPEAALPRTNLGRVLAKRGDVAGAIAAHESAVALDPTSHIAWNNLGVARRQGGDLARARDACREALALRPGGLAARVGAPGGRGRGAALARRRVLRAYRDRLARAPGDDGLHAALARFLVESGGDLGLAREHAERACALAPASPRAWEALALVDAV